VVSFPCWRGRPGPPPRGSRERAWCAPLSCLVTLALGLGALAAVPATAYGQSLEPRAYSNVPVGLNYALAGYLYTQGSVGTDASIPIKDFTVRTNGPIVAYVRTLDVWGQAAKLDLIVPYVWLSAKATVAGQGREREVSGLADPRVRFSVNVYGSPALSLEQFAQYKQDLIVGTSLQVSAPGGQYDSDKLVNIGTNRWSFKPELGLSKVLGPWTLELIPSVTFFTDNNDFFGGQRLAQDPLYAVQGHLVYSFEFGAWLSLNSTYYTGGRTTVNHVQNDDRQENVRLGITAALPLSRHFSLRLNGSSGVYTRTGTNFDVAGIALQYRWGGDH
jgi:outer membrane putative beta-barrel porin/alpha-amylase